LLLFNYSFYSFLFLLLSFGEVGRGFFLTPSPCGEGWGEAKKTAHRDSMSRFSAFTAMAFPLFTVVKSFCATTNLYFVLVSSFV